MTFTWNPQKSFIEAGAFEGVSYVINLAGAGIADALWTKSRKKILIESRVQSNAVLAKYISTLKQPPLAYLSAAAIGIYGNRGEETLTETATLGEKGFLSHCCKEWETAIQRASSTMKIRSLTFRIGIVLSTRGGALKKMLLPLKFFVANYFGNGKQWYAWIHIDDLCRMFISGMENENWNGIYNAVAPNSLTNKELAKEMINALDKKALLLSAPTSGLRMGMGEMADILLSSNKVVPKRIKAAGFKFLFPNAQEAIKDLVKRKI
jgi:uncharacterized protein (TIGR01777 family)